MNQTIQTFYQQASIRNFARDFQLRITSFIVNGINQLGEEDLVFLKSATLPGKTISIQNAPYMGLNFNIPGSVEYDGSKNWNVKFYCTQDYNLRQMLEMSMGDTFDQETSTGNLEPRDLQQYKIILSLIDDQLNIIRSYELLGCFITNIGSTDYNITGSGGIQEIQATIAYQYWVPLGGGTGYARGRRGGVSVGVQVGVSGRNGSVSGSVFGTIGGSLLSQAGAAIGNRFGAGGSFVGSLVGGIAGNAVGNKLNSKLGRVGNFLGG